MAVFENYSKYYDLLYKDKDYKLESEYVSSLIKAYNSNAKTILELGCGTGRHASFLIKNGYNILGIDLSETMLEYAKRLDVPCQIGDVRTFRINRQFDAVISLFHILSYQTTDEDVINFFNTVKYHLVKNGIIIFDIWYKNAVLSQIPEKRVKELEDKYIKVKRYCVPNHIKEKSLVEVNYNIEIMDKMTGMIETVKEQHNMRYFSDKEINEFASNSGIEIVHSEEWLTKKEPSESTWGVCFIGVSK